MAPNGVCCLDNLGGSNGFKVAGAGGEGVNASLAGYHRPLRIVSPAGVLYDDETDAH